MVEQRVALVAARAMVSDPGDGTFPLTEADMEWYLAYFEE